jgi:hypothetical protein
LRQIIIQSNRILGKVIPDVFKAAEFTLENFFGVDAPGGLDIQFGTFFSATKSISRSSPF